jgi:hypothetical protein
MVVRRGVSQEQSRAEASKDLNQPASPIGIIRQFAIVPGAREKLGTEQRGCRLRFLVPDVRKVLDCARRLALVTAAQHADTDRRSIRFRACQSAGTRVLGVIRMGDDGQDPFVREIKSHDRAFN